MSTNPTSFRFPLNLQGKAHEDVVEAIQYHDDAITDLQQAIPKLKSQINGTIATAAAAGANVVGGASEAITQIIANFGFVNNQTGNVSYTTLQSDFGGLIVLDDPSPVAVSLSVLSSAPGIQLPWWAVFLNLGAGTTTLTPQSGTISYAGTLGAASMTIATGNFALVYFDGTDFWAALGISTGGGGGASNDFAQIFQLMGA